MKKVYVQFSKIKHNVKLFASNESKGKHKHGEWGPEKDMIKTSWKFSFNSIWHFYSSSIYKEKKWHISASTQTAISRLTLIIKWETGNFVSGKHCMQTWNIIIPVTIELTNVFPKLQVITCLFTVLSFI